MRRSKHLKVNCKFREVIVMIDYKDYPCKNCDNESSKSKPSWLAWLLFILITSLLWLGAIHYIFK
jgi:hypothetical protein